MIEFPSINRSVLIIKFKQPYVEWTKTLPDQSDLEKEFPVTLEEINTDPTALLIPEVLDAIDFEAYIEHSWVLLFELKLFEWNTDKKLWPKKRSLKMFNEWFELQLSSLAVDLWGKEPLDYVD